MRKKLSPRRPSVTTSVEWTSPSDQTMKLIVTFGFDENNHIKEIFCASFKATSEFVALMNDACVLVSRLLQMELCVQDIVGSLSENRREGEKVGLPASFLGAILREALKVEGEVL